MRKIFILVSLLLTLHYVTHAQINTLDSTYSKILKELVQKNRYKPYIKKDKIDNEDFEGFYTRAFEYYNVGEFEIAYQYFDSANRVLHEFNKTQTMDTKKYLNAGPLFYMAVCKEFSQDYDSALLLLEKAIELDPLYEDAYNEIGVIYLSEKKYELAISWFKQVLSHNARNENACYNLGYLYFILQDLGNAQKYLLQTLSINPKNDRVCFLLTYVHLQNGNLKDAELSCSKSIKINPDNEYAYLVRAAIYTEQKQYVKALNDSKRYYEWDSSSLYGTALLASLYVMTGQVDKGLPLLLKTTNMEDDTASVEFKSNARKKEFYNIVGILNEKQLPEKELQAAHQMLRYFYAFDENYGKMKALLKQHEHSEICYRIYLLALYQSTNFREYKYEVQQLYSINNALPTSYYIEGKVFLADKKNKQAIECFKRAIEVNPSDPLYYYLTAVYCYSFNNKEEMMSLYNKTIALDSGFMHAYFDRARLYYYKMQKYDSALVDFLMAVKINPAKKEAHYMAGRTFGELRQYDSALKYLTNAIELDSTHHVYYFYRTVARVALSDTLNALKDIETALLLDSSFIEAFELQAKIYRGMKKEKEAIQCTNKMIELKPNDIYGYQFRGNMFYTFKQYTEAIADFEKALSIQDDDIYSLRRLGLIYTTIHDSTEGLKYYKRAINVLQDETLDNRLTLGSIYSEMKNYNEAIRQYQYALKLDSVSSSAYGNMGWNYYLGGDYKACIRNSEKAIQLDSMAFYAMYNIALSELRLGYYEKAKELYIRYTQLNKQYKNSKPKGAIDDLKELIDKNILVKESEYIIKNILEY